MKEITVYENADDTRDWLADPETGETNEEAVSAYYRTVRKELKSRYPGFKICFEDERTTGVSFIITGVDMKTEWDMLNELPSVYTQILSDMGNDWDSWYPSA